jgi:hypothetical protein
VPGFGQAPFLMLESGLCVGGRTEEEPGACLTGKPAIVDCAIIMPGVVSSIVL